MACVETVQDHVAQAGAFVIHQRQHDRLVAEILAQANHLPGFVFESQLQRDLSVQVLIDADALHHHGHGCRWNAILLRRQRLAGSAAVNQPGNPKLVTSHYYFLASLRLSAALAGAGGFRPARMSSR